MDKEELLQELEREGYLKTLALREAFRAVDRKDFVPEKHAKEAYGNYPLDIGGGQTISQPLTVTFILELLAPRLGENILDVGAGSGWQTALIAHLVGPRGKVVAMERIPELYKLATKNLAKYPELQKRVTLLRGDASGGAPESLVPPGGFDRIAAAASARELPPAWKRQLRLGGRIVAPVGTDMVTVDKLSEKEYKTKAYPGFMFVPLVEG